MRIEQVNVCSTSASEADPNGVAGTNNRNAGPAFEHLAHFPDGRYNTSNPSYPWPVLQQGSHNRTTMFTPLFLGLDLSTQQLKASIIDIHENLIQECAVHFDTDLPHHGTQNGAIQGEREGEMTCPVAVWLESMDLLMKRLQESGVEFGRILAVSGAAQQHGSVYWNKSGCETLGSLDPKKALAEQLAEGFSLPRAPLWQDSSTTAECREMEEKVGGAQVLANRTGSR